MNKHESRIAALEQNRQRHSGVEVLVVRGGLLLPGEDPIFGRVGNMCLERGEDEAFPAFPERTKTAAGLAGQRQVIIGGLGE